MRVKGVLNGIEVSVDKMEGVRNGETAEEMLERRRRRWEKK